MSYHLILGKEQVMSALVLFGFLILNSLISFYNAWAAGRGWTEAKEAGGWIRVVNVSAVVMAACGFTWVILTIETIAVVLFNYLEPADAEALFNLGYLLIIFPVLGSGIALWAHSLVVAYKRRQMGDFVVAGWNTYAQIHNMTSAARHVPDALSSVFSSLGKSKSGRNALLIIVLVILALGGGILITVAIVRWADENHQVSVEQEYNIDTDTRVR